MKLTSQVVIPVALGCAFWLGLQTPAGALERPRLPPSQSDFGGTGLLQMPSGRMAPEGEFSVNLNLTDTPYNRLAISLQVVEWLEATIRYTEISNRLYGPRELSGNQSYKDRGIDLKLRLLEESYYLPELSVGLRDTAGTGLFASEFLAASKRFQNFDVTLGLGWGYMAQRQHIRNPFGKLSDKFYTRPAEAGGTHGGKVGVDALFRGPYAAFFGGVEYHTPWRPLRLKLEYDSNDYQQEPLANPQVSKAPLNVGAVYRLGDGLDIQLGYERGDVWMLGFNLRTNFNDLIAQTKFDPKPEPVAERTPAQATPWPELAQTLDSNGFKVQRIQQEGNTLAIYGQEQRFRDPDKALDRAARLTTNRAPAEYTELAFVQTNHAVPTTRTTVARPEFDAYARYDADEFSVQRRKEPHQSPASTALYTRPAKTPALSLYPDINQSIGGPDGFYLYQITANASADYQFAPGWELSSTVAANVINNFDQFKYTAASSLPRVRTNIREYLTTSDVTLRNLQLTHFHRLADNVYSQLYGGYLEFMYAGAGGELLYKTPDSPFAFALNLNAVRQRNFAQDFGLRDYETTTAHLTAYYQTDFHDLLAVLSVGRYLAKDDGFTVELVRKFDSGIAAGAFATITDVSAEQYGEGSFTKGFYLTIPFDVFFVRSTTKKGRLSWSPLTRDGGQPLGRKYELYGLYD